MRCFLLAILLSVRAGCMAQTLKVDDYFTSHWEANALVGLNNDGWEVDFGATYFPVDYVGIKADIGLAAEIIAITDWLEEDYYYDFSIWDKYTARFKFNPSLVLRTPRIAYWKNQDAGFYLFAEPGIVLSPGASDSHNARWLCYDFKGGINIQLQQLIFFAGYGISNFSLYSGFPSNSPNGDNYMTHFGFIGTAYKF